MVKYLAVPITALVLAGPAYAQDVELKPLVDARVRYEHVDQDGLTRDADALTIRIRSGVEATLGGWSALVEAQGTLAAVDRYYDGVTGDPSRPLVADPENIALYRAQLRYQGEAFAVTAGRQRIILDDERFVGNVGFRDNAQTFDAVRAEVTPLPALKLDVTYAWSVRTIWGINGTGARPTAIGGDNVFANLSYATPIGTLTGFAYLVDQDEAAVQGYRLSSQSYGARLAGSRALSPAAKLAWQLSYARQSDWRRNPNSYSANYYLADATLTVSGWSLNAGYEVLGADNGTALTSFQTPLGTNFKFQGWADKFLTTPPNGVRDLYLGGGYGWKNVLGADAITLGGTWHRFRSDRLGERYGTEVDLLASVKVRRALVSLRHARYRADSFATDTDKTWVQLDWAY
ncbi:MAG: hypothetical protein K0S66_2369 [Sphingomonas sp.]|nr:hypothetical protein [Sphingomonas sp.]